MSVNIGCRPSQLRNLNGGSNPPKQFKYLQVLESIEDLPTDLKPDAVYFVRDGDSIDMYVVNSDGSAYEKFEITNEVFTVENIAELKEFEGFANITVILRGYYSQGDGGGGEFFWHTSSTATDNGGTIIQANGVVTGRWIRVVQNEIDLRAFGAKGDGVTDDTLSIQSCIDYCPNGLTIKSKGIFHLYDTIEIDTKENISLNLQGCTFVQKTTFKPPFKLIDCVSVNISEGKFQGIGGVSGEWVNGAGITTWNGVAAIYLENCNKINIFKNQIEDFAGCGIYFIESDNLKIQSNTIIGIGSTYIDFGDNSRGFAIGGLSDDFDRMDFAYTITDNNISNTAFGIFFNRANSVIIQNNYIHDIVGQHGIYIIECSNVNISSNVFLNIAIQAIKTQNEDYVGRSWAPIGTPHTSNYVVANNTIENAAQGIAFLTAPLYFPHDQLFVNINISNNVIKTVSEAGILTQRVTDANINNNIILDSLKYGIRIESFGGKINNNYIKNIYSSGIYGYLYKNTFLNSNYIEDAGYNNLTGGAGGDHPIYLYSGLDLPSDVAATFILSTENDSILVNTVTITDAASSSLFAALDSKLLVEVHGMKTNTTKPFRTNSRLRGASNNQFNGYFDATDQSSAVVYPGFSKKQLFANTDPVTGGYAQASKRGDICWNSNPSAAGQYVGWVCTTAGTPGTWRPFGVIA